MLPEKFSTLIKAISSVLIGKEHEVRLVLAGFFSGGHILLEDIPGVGKTTLAKATAHALGLDYKRIQFTSDLLPADILGVSYFDAAQNGFVFQPGAVFTQCLLADEINRATPKTQSALLEAMEEHQVSIEGVTRSLSEPFFVIATQNPFEESGTFPLPSSQLDRFALSLSLGYPDAEAERVVLRGATVPSSALEPVVDTNEVFEIMAEVEKIAMSDALLDYVQHLVQFTRESGLFERGLSTRGAMAMTKGAKAWALMEGRSYVTPDDIQALLPAIIGHRLRLRSGEPLERTAMAERIIGNLPIDA